MTRYLALTLLAAILAGHPAWAQSPSYHLERIQIQTQAFLATLPPMPKPTDPSLPLEQQLDQSTANSTWSRQMVDDDLAKILATSQELSKQLREGETTTDDLLSAKSTVESLARRLRVSSAALSLSSQSQTQLDFLMLELEEASLAMDAQREQLLAQEKARRSRASWDTGLGFGYGYGFGPWVPYGWGTYYPYGCGYGPGPYYGGFPRVYGFGPRGCR